MKHGDIVRHKTYGLCVYIDDKGRRSKPENECRLLSVKQDRGMWSQKTSENYERDSDILGNIFKAIEDKLE